MLRKILATALVAFVPALAAAEERLLFGRDQMRLVSEPSGAIVCVGCRGPDSAERDVIRTQFIGQRVMAHAFNAILMQDDGGRACPAGDWYVISLARRTATPIHLSDCTEITRYDLSVREDLRVVVTLVDARNRRSTVTIP